MEIDTDARLQIDGRLALLLDSSLALQHINELLSRVVVLAGPRSGLELGDEYRHLFRRIRLQRLLENHRARNALLRERLAGDRDGNDSAEREGHDPTSVRLHVFLPSPALTHPRMANAHVDRPRRANASQRSGRTWCSTALTALSRSRRTPEQSIDDLIRPYL